MYDITKSDLEELVKNVYEGVVRKWNSMYVSQKAIILTV
jgi:hypothetical protein